MTRRFGTALVRFSCDHPRLVTWAMVLSTLALLTLAALPSIRPDVFRPLHPLVIDTDPENMLSANEPVRVFHNAMKREFALHDVIVVGVVNEAHPDGVFNVGSLGRIHDLAVFAAGLRWPDPEKPDRIAGVVDVDMLAPSSVDNIEQAGLGAVRFSWLMSEPPASRDEALAVRERTKKLPMLDNTLVSGDGKAIALYLPVTTKDVSNRIRDALLEKTRGWEANGDQVHITGLPVAEDTFGVEMFVQMAISAPLAMLTIFGVMWLFFRHLRLIAAPMIVAMVTPMATMALLVISGNTVHIMSSMIPVFLMPIAVLDAVHILSEFFDRYQKTRDRRRTVAEVMEHLFAPMLYTSLTTMVGFASLALTPIPPFQTFGVFIAIGVGLAWLWTVTFIPAYIVLLPEGKLSGFGHVNADAATDATMTGRLLARLGPAMAAKAPAVLAVMALMTVAAGYGISRIVINDNPVDWFEETHAIRVADRVLNRHFAGTYMAHLALESGDAGAAEAFKQPEVLGYVERLQRTLEQDGDVGKSTSLADIVKTVHRELLLGEPRQFRIPDSAAAVAQTLLTFESSHRPHDLWHFVTPDFRKANIWVQLKSGDNRDMARVVRAVERFMADNPPPVALTARWFGLNYVNLEWQDKMVSGMVNSLLGSFATVLVMMVILFRSLLWGLLCMVPLSATIGLSYGVVGLIGKDFDMPIAVLSSLSLGLAVDYAIHFLSRARVAHAEAGSWRAAVGLVYAEPARAIVRNAVVLAVGFTPLIAAPLMPYQTVGFFMAAISLVGGFATILILPALLTVFERRMFRSRKAVLRAAGLLAALVVSIGPAAAQTAPTVDEIIHRTNLAAYFQGRDGRARIHLEIKDAQDRVRSREVTILRRDDPPTDELAGNAYRGEQKYYVYFHEPADVARMALLVWKHQVGDDDRWLFLPALDLVRRIAASDKRTSFAGSDFFYEDVSGRSIDADEHELVGTTEHYYVLRNRPKDAGAVEFSYYDMHIHKGTFLPIQAEYFDRNGAKYRVYKTLAVDTIQGRPTVTRASMSDLKKGGTTTVGYRDVAYDVGLPEEIFTERFLRQAPAGLLR